MQHVLKVQQISLLPKYIKWICTGIVYVHLHRQTLVTEKYIYIHTHTSLSMSETILTYLCLYKSNIQSIPLTVTQSLRNTFYISHGRFAKNFLFLSAPECKGGAQSVYMRNVFCSKKCSNVKLLQSICDGKMLSEVLYQLSHVNNET